MTDPVTPKPMQGTWTLTAPDGRTWQADSPLRCVSMEQRERVPADVALSRIRAELTATDAPAAEPYWLFEHADGRTPVVAQGFAFTDGDPLWRRCYPVEVRVPQPAPRAEGERTLEVVEERLRAWRWSYMNIDGDRLALDDFMDAGSLEDLIDYVCAPIAAHPTEAVEPAATQGPVAQVGPELYTHPAPSAAEIALRKALEFAEYMATGAEQFADAAVALSNEYYEADNIGRDPDIETHGPAFDERHRGLSRSIYEFRKRAAIAQQAKGDTDV